MLKFLTHKLRTHSLNEESASEKVGVAAGRLEAKVTAPPENGRLARTKERSEAAPPAAGAGRRPGPLWCRLLLQVEERDSGTESDDEADRDAGECRPPRPGPSPVPVEPTIHLFAYYLYLSTIALKVMPKPGRSLT